MISTRVRQEIGPSRELVGHHPGGEDLRSLVAYAVSAPSSHNSQPWRFRINAGRVEVHADRRRRLPVVDPRDRELTISCGAALFNVRLALRHSGRAEVTRVLPETDKPDLLAVVNVGGRHEPSGADETMFGAINLRHTNRNPYDPTPLPAFLKSRLENVVRIEGCSLRFVSSEEAAGVGDLITEGDKRQMADSAFRAELASWLRPNDGRRRDGMPGYAHGLADLMSRLAPFVVKHFNLGRRQARRDRDLLTRSAAVAVISTPQDSTRDWLAAGQALQALLLAARAEGVWCGFMNQPMELPELRSQLQAQLGIAGAPQLLLRLGYGGDVRPTPRRGIDEVIID